MSITERINDNLAISFNKEGENYKALICDENGTNPEIVNKPTDIDIGVLTSQIEYLRRMSLDLIKQLFIDQSSEEFLKYQLEEFFSSLRLEDETDVDWIQRTIATVFQKKVSTATIIYSLRPYSTMEPEIVNVSTEGAFADFCFADIYESGSYILDGETYYYAPAISGDYENAFFTIKVTLYDTESQDLWTVTNILDRMLAAGITYILEIKTTP